MISTLPNEILLRYIVSINPTTPVPDRRAITIKHRSSLHNYQKYEFNSFLILIPTPVKPSTDWSRMIEATFPPEDLDYIDTLMSGIAREKRQQMISAFSLQAVESSNDSSIPEPRRCRPDLSGKITSDDGESDGASDGSEDLFRPRPSGMNPHMVNEWINQHVNELD